MNYLDWLERKICKNTEAVAAMKAELASQPSQQPHEGKMQYWQRLQSVGGEIAELEYQIRMDKIKMDEAVKRDS